MMPIAYVNRYNTWESARKNERDLILNRAIVRFFQEMSGRLAIRGGTALHKLLVHPAPKFSEDIDLILTGNDNIPWNFDVALAYVCEQMFARI